MSSREAGTIWILEDVSEARRALTEVQAIMTNASIGIFFTRERVITRANSAFDRMFGYQDGETIGHLTRVLYADEQAFARLGAEAYGVLGQGKPFQAESIMVRKDGTPMWVRLIGYAINSRTRARARSG
jgi:PAS domain S-box-containing protein